MNGNCRHIKNFILLIHTANAIHLFEIFHITGTNCLFSIHPQLAEIQWTSIKYRYICHPNFPLLLPAIYADSSTQYHLFIAYRTNDCGRFLGSAIFRTDKNRFIEGIGSTFHIDCDSTLNTVILCPAPFSCLSQGRSQRGFRRLTSSVVEVTALGRNPYLTSQ